MRERITRKTIAIIILLDTRHGGIHLTYMVIYNNERESVYATTTLETLLYNIKKHASTMHQGRSTTLLASKRTPRSE